MDKQTIELTDDEVTRIKRLAGPRDWRKFALAVIRFQLDRMDAAQTAPDRSEHG